MKSTLISIALICFVWCDINGQPPITKKKPFIITVETLSDEKIYGILHKIDSSRLQLLPDKKVRFEHMRKQAISEDIGPLNVVPQQIKSLRVHRKGTTRTAVGLGILVGLTAGTLVGAIATPKSTCPTNSGLCQAFDGLEKISNSMEGMAIGTGLGALAGWIIGNGKKKRFLINGDSRRYNDVQRMLSNKIGN
jgi:hypothetical protein